MTLLKDKKNTQPKKVENYGLLGEIAEDLNPGDTFLHSSEGLLQRGEQGARMHKSFAAKKPRWLEHPKITVNLRKPDIAS